MKSKPDFHCEKFCDCERILSRGKEKKKKDRAVVVSDLSSKEYMSDKKYLDEWYPRVTI